MKQHFEILDGLRGTAAILVVVFHIVQWIFPNYLVNPLRHCHLAVDFFFLLSGFVVGYAYDDRWQKIRIRDFVRIRLVRLHPLVPLAVTLSALAYIFDPFVGNAQHVRWSILASNIALGALLLPSPPLPNRIDMTHSLNGPHWSLLQEYVANFVYAIVGHKLSVKHLGVLVSFFAGLTVYTALHHTNLQGGWTYETFRMAPIRVAFPFFTGLLIYRLDFRVSLKFAYPILSIILLAIFAAPPFHTPGIFEACCIIIVFPLIVAAGAGSKVGDRLSKICKFSGELSYPIYILHHPFTMLFSHWLAVKSPSYPIILLVSISLFIFCILLAWAAFKFYDVPIRARLTAKFKK